MVCPPATVLVMLAELTMFVTAVPSAVMLPPDVAVGFPAEPRVGDLDSESGVRVDSRIAAYRNG